AESGIVPRQDPRCRRSTAHPPSPKAAPPRFVCRRTYAMRILLINPPYIGWLNDIKVEPIGLLYIASFLRERGHEVELYDPYMGEPEDLFIDKVLHWAPRIVACAVYTVSEEFCFRMARLVKRLNPQITFVAGGPHATFTPQRMLRKCEAIDLITHRE